MSGILARTSMQIAGANSQCNNFLATTVQLIVVYIIFLFRGIRAMVHKPMDCN